MIGCLSSCGVIDIFACDSSLCILEKKKLKGDSGKDVERKACKNLLFYHFLGWVPSFVLTLYPLFSFVSFLPASLLNQERKNWGKAGGRGERGRDVGGKTRGRC